MVVGGESRGSGEGGMTLGILCATHPELWPLQARGSFCETLNPEP